MLYWRVTWDSIIYYTENVRFKSTLKQALPCIYTAFIESKYLRSQPCKSYVQMTVPSAVGIWSGLLYTICRYTYIRYLNMNITHGFPRTNQGRQWVMFFRLSNCADVSGKRDLSAQTSPVKYSCWTYLHNTRLINSAFCSLKLCFGCVLVSTERNANNYP